MATTEHNGDGGGQWSAGDRLTIYSRGTRVEGGYFVGYIPRPPSGVRQTRCKVRGDSGREYEILGGLEASFGDFDILKGDK